MTTFNIPESMIGTESEKAFKKIIENYNVGNQRGFIINGHSYDLDCGEDFQILQSNGIIPKDYILPARDPAYLKSKTIESEEFYNLMQTYRYSDTVSAPRAYNDVIAYIDKEKL